MTRSRQLLTVGLVTAVAVAVAASYRTALTDRPAVEEAAGPLGYPGQLDLDELQPDQEVAADIPVRNNSGVTIRLFEFRTSCGCMSPARRVPGGRVEPFGEAILAPGESVTVVLSTRTALGEPAFAHRLRFRTDHPDLPEAVVVIRGRAFRGVAAVPEVLTFDPVYPGGTCDRNGAADGPPRVGRQDPAPLPDRRNGRHGPRRTAAQSGRAGHAH